MIVFVKKWINHLGMERTNYIVSDTPTQEQINNCTQGESFKHISELNLDTKTKNLLEQLKFVHQCGS
jgi:hypothetical protein